MFAPSLERHDFARGKTSSKDPKSVAGETEGGNDHYDDRDCGPVIDNKDIVEQPHEPSPLLALNGRAYRAE
jgi:hypothetical protein